MIRLIFLIYLVASYDLIRVYAADRVALVIGNSSYQHANKLANATSDSTAIAKLLRNAGFEVIGSTGGISNASTEQFYDALENFKQAAAGARVGLVYYAGHGVEVDGKNYLLPVDASLESAANLRTQAVALDTILADMKEARLPAKMVILDCCRDNPLTRSWLTTRSTKRGMAEVKEDSLPEATMIMFSTAPGMMALDGTGGNSPFTKALLAHLTQPGTNAFDAFLQVSDGVAAETNDGQVPWIKFDGAGRAFRQLVLHYRKPQPIEDDPPLPPVEPPVRPPTPAMAPVQSPTVNSPIVTPEAPPAPTLDMDSLFANGPYSTSPKTHKIAIVMRVQALLKESGLYDQTPDGAPGPNTQAALRRWQEQHGKVTGRLDSQTLEKMGLENIPQRILPRPNAPSSIPPSSKGSNREITVDEFMRRAKALEGN